MANKDLRMDIVIVGGGAWERLHRWVSTIRGLLMDGTSGDSRAVVNLRRGRGATKERVLHIFSATAYTAIIRRVGRYKLALPRRQPGRSAGGSVPCRKTVMRSKPAHIRSNTRVHRTQSVEINTFICCEERFEKW